jgi:hypothetical protein
MSSTALISVTFLSVLMASKLITVTISKECVREKFVDAFWAYRCWFCMVCFLRCVVMSYSVVCTEDTSARQEQVD